MLSAYQAFCLKEAPFKQTAVDDYTAVNVFNDQEKGFILRYCRKVVNETNPLEIQGVWDPEDRWVVNRLPNRGNAFNEFQLILSGVNVRTGFLFLPKDLEELYSWIFEEDHVQVDAIHVYRVEDSSSDSQSIVTVFIQICSKAKLAKTIRKIISDTPLVIENKLVALHPSHYVNSITIAINGEPTIIIKPKEKWESILEICIILLVASFVILLCWIYRKALSKWYRRVTRMYRMKRRQVVFEEFDLPVNMYYDPKEIKNDTTYLSFETPYGDIHLVKPLVQSIPETKYDFIVAEEL